MKSDMVLEENAVIPLFPFSLKLSVGGLPKSESGLHRKILVNRRLMKETDDLGPQQAVLQDVQ